MNIQSVDEEEYPIKGIGKRLTCFEELLRCPFCNELIDNAMELPCSHAFCALCLIKHFDQTKNHTTSNSCPVCRERTELKAARPARFIKELVQQYKALRSELIATVRQSSSVRDNFNSEDKTQSKQKHSKYSAIRHLHIPHFHGIPKPKVKVMLSTLCKDVQAPSVVNFLLEGERDVLERRYRDIVQLNNAQIDSLSPLSFEQILAKVKNDETALKTQSKKTSMVKEKILQGDNRNNPQLQELIQAARRTIQKSRQPLEAESKCGEESIDDQSRSLANKDDDGTVRETVGCQTKWRAVMSSKLNRPFYYNTLTNIGQFETPRDFKDCNDDVVLDDTIADESHTMIEYSMGTCTSSVKEDRTGEESSDVAMELSGYESSKKRRMEGDSQCALESQATPMLAADDEIILVVESSRASWTCDACTYVNEDASLTRCAVCETQNKKSNIVRRSQSSQVQLNFGQSSSHSSSSRGSKAAVRR